MLAGSLGLPCFLIVDDSPLGLKWLAQILVSGGPCEIIEAHDGRDAIDRLSVDGKRVDAVISDLRMPRMNGLELLKTIRLARTNALQNIPFFIVTGFADRAMAGLALGLDVDAFLARPVKMQALKRHLIRTCAHRRPAKTPSEAREAYGDVDVSSATLAESDVALPSSTDDPLWPAVAREIREIDEVVSSRERLVDLNGVADGAMLARDAANSAGVVLLKAGEELTANLKAVLMSYAEIDKSLAQVWVSVGSDGARDGSTAAQLS